jgi:HK97 gp10 family phage protein
MVGINIMPKQSFQLISDTLSEHLRRCTSERLLYEVGQELDVVGANIVDVAKELVPVDTGFLQSSIYHQMIDQGTVEVGAEAEYASYVEMGTYKSSPQPYLRPAIDSQLPELEQRMMVALRNALGV